MKKQELNSWQAIQDEVLRRIDQGIWKPGEQISHESELAEEFGCARATVNRALRQLADAGLLERKRRSGTRVASRPIRKVNFSIPVLRQEIESKGLTYSYRLLSQERVLPPESIRTLLSHRTNRHQLHLMALHSGDGLPYVLEDRWINLAAVPEAEQVDFSQLSANEWLLGNIPFESGELTFSATAATAQDAMNLNCHENDSLFRLDRITRRDETVLTCVRLTFAPGYQLHASLWN